MINAGPGCERTRQLAAELALGIAPGDERARALDHAASCPECRSLLREYAALADELLLLAPVHEPPAGFEARVRDRMAAGAPRGVFGRLPAIRGLRTAAALLAVAAVTAGAMLAVFRDDRQDASRYRDALEAVNGEYFDAADLREPGGGRAGEVLAYQGFPSWLLVRVAPSYRSESYKCELLTHSGRRIRLRAFQLDEASGTWSQAIPVGLRDVAEVRVFDGDHEGALRASFEQE